jgi:hypothetical protein
MIMYVAGAVVHRTGVDIEVCWPESCSFLRPLVIKASEETPGLSIQRDASQGTYIVLRVE